MDTKIGYCYGMPCAWADGGAAIIDYFAVGDMKINKTIIHGIIIPFSILMIWAGMLWSRAALSIGTMIFVGVTLVDGPLKAKWIFFKAHRELRMMSLLFAIPLFTGLWSEDRSAWQNIMIGKLPLLVFPFCAASLLDIPAEKLRHLLRVMILLALVACLPSVIAYLQHRDLSNASYLKASLLHVPMDDDHVRFAWLLVLVHLFMLHVLLSSGKDLKRWERGSAILIIIFLTFYFHLLSSRTGLLGFYVVNSIAILIHARRKMWVVWLGVLIFCAILAWLLMPTFQNRMRFMRWDYQNYSRSGYVEGLSDAPRMVSLRGGISILHSHPLIGTGFGDLAHDIEAWYGENAPYLKGYERLLPSNEFLLHAVAGGVILGILACICIIYPLFNCRRKNKLLWVGFHLVAILGFLYEVGLETQYGVMLYGFFGCWLAAGRVSHSSIQAIH